MKAIVTGAGLAGLAAAYRLQRAGWEVIVLEATSIVGGRTASFHRQGYQLEKGATQLSTGYQSYLALAADVGLADQIVPCGNEIMLMRDGRLHAIDGTRPLQILLSGALGWRSKLLMLRAIKDFRALDPPMDVLDVSAAWRSDTESAEQYCDRRLNRPIYDVLVDPLIRTYTINRGANVSVVEWYSALANLAGNRMVALRGGIGRLPTQIAATLDVRLSWAVTEVRTGSRGISVAYDSMGGAGTMEADACVVATRLPQAHAIVAELSAAMAPLARLLRYNRAVVVHLGYTVRTVSKALGVLVPTVEHEQIGLVWLEHNKLAETAPPGHSLVTCYFEEGGLDTVQPSSDAQFIAIAETFTTRLFPELAGRRDMVAVSRWDAAIPNPAPGVYRAVHEMRERLDPRHPIQLAGDYFTCTGQNSAIHWGQVAADNILAREPAA